MVDSAPRGDLRPDRIVVTPAALRRFSWGESAMRAGRERRLLLALHEPTDAAAGFTEVSYDVRVPSVVSQAGTGTVAEHRGHDLAKWLKARMVERVISEWPRARYMRTGNAATNVAMLSINERLGFERVWTVMNWQLPIEKARRYLADSS
jgi:hypothetical protein